MPLEDCPPISASCLKNLLQGTYKDDQTAEQLGSTCGYSLDYSLSSEERKVYVKGSNVVFAVRGTKTLSDWKTNAVLAFGQLKTTKRYKRELDAFEVRNGCAGGNLACNVAIGLMDRDSSIKTALIICADTLSRIISPEIPECHPLLYFGDGAAAVVLKRNHPRYQLLSFAEHTDGDLGDLLRIEAGGTRNPITPHFKDWSMTYAKVDPAAFANLIDKVYLKEYLAVINKALERSGHTVSEMEFILMNQVKNSLRAHILQGIGMPEDHTYVSLDEFGHMGPADCLFTMAKAHKEGLLPEGKLAILASSGLGFSWAASIIRC